MNKQGDSEIDVFAKLLEATIEEIGKLDEMIKYLNAMEEIQAGRNVKRTWIIAQAGNTYSLGNFHNPRTLYVDNIDGSEDVTLVFDNEPVSFKILAGKGMFIPCQGVKSFVVDHDCRVLAINQSVLGGSI